ncbi:hypothetical protein [Gemmobacter sp.]|uniref:hypothetical protein n=1 Tax=Gemmobacter sp. TaxID=1898957 RepID=UPI0025C2F3C8|nr:hypothetical protein [Gemmobacter sp.]
MQLGLVKSGGTTLVPFLTGQHSANAITQARSFYPLKKGTKLPARWKETRKALRTWLRQTNGHYLIVSSEFFSDADPAQLAPVVTPPKSKLPANPIRRWFQTRIIARFRPEPTQRLQVIAYARPHADRILSAFIEQTKSGYTTLDFDLWLDRYLVSSRALYTPRFRAWRRVFGKNFKLYPFIRSRLREGDVVQDFFSKVLGHDRFTVSDSLYENQTVTLKALVGLQMINREMRALGIPPAARIQLCRFVSRDLKADPQAAKPRLGQDNLARIAEACLEDAKRLDRAFFREPLFQTDLEQALANAVPGRLDLSPAHHFSPAEQDRLRGMVRDLATAMADGYETWLKYYNQERERYNRGLGRSEEDGGAMQNVLRELARLLNGI